MSINFSRNLMPLVFPDFPLFKRDMKSVKRRLKMMDVNEIGSVLLKMMNCQFPKNEVKMQKNDLYSNFYLLCINAGIFIFSRETLVNSLLIIY